MKITKLYYAFFALLLASQVWASSPSVQLLSERHRTEWNWVEYRLALKNLSDSQLKNLTVRYFAENPRIQYCKANPNESICAGMQFGQYGIDSTLRAEVDYYSVVKSVKPKFYYGAKYTVIELKFSGSIPAKKKAKVNFRIMKKNYPAWDCTHDYSFQKNAAVQEENYMMAVYDANGNLLWGNDPVALKRDTANVYWNDRSGTTVVSQYDGSDSSKVFDGRFWMLEGNSLSYEETKALDSIGVRILESTRYGNKDLHLLKAVKVVTKKTLSKVVSGFYNAFKVDDTTPLSLAVSPDDIYEEKQTCDANGSCSNVVTERSAFDMVVECWPDISMNECKNVILGCGGDEVGFDRSVFYAKMQKKNVQCLERHKDVRNIKMYRENSLDTYEGRSAINIENLQLNLPEWKNALKNAVTTDWLNDAKYTGKGIVVDVHDDAIDFTHLAFCEKGPDGGMIERKAPGYWDDRKVIDDRGVVNGHGTHVAGIIGGNGNMSEMVKGASAYDYRGVAPKVKYLSHDTYFGKESGHVANHSHKMEGPTWSIGEKNDKGEVLGTYLFYYVDEAAKIDKDIFNNFTDPSDYGDGLTKTIVATVGNGAYYDRFNDEGKRTYAEYNYGWMSGYHSATNQSKNPILVGAYGKPYDVSKAAPFPLAYFSSLGPTWDGRIKPDVMAPGYGIISTIPEKDVRYGSKSGTSQAAPFVSGIVALMYQKFGEKTGKLSMRNSTSKALLIHTAIDMKGSGSINLDIKAPTPYTPGPDFATGWGRVDAAAALGMMDEYDGKKFAKFREINVFARNESRWTIDVSEKKSFRTTLVWDDAPGNVMDVYTNPKLINDLDLWLVSPSGKIYYPWRLDPLSTQNVDEKGNRKGNAMSERLWGLEEISVDAASKPAYKHCSPMRPTTLYDGCFDRLNNVEVVDVDAADAEVGTWQVVVKGYHITSGNGSDRHIQIASLASDYELKDPVKGDGASAPVFELQSPEVIYLGDGYLEHNVYFGPETQFGDGGHIFLFDGFNGFVGDFSDANPLANRRVVVKSSFLQIVPARKNATAPWPKYSIVGVEHIPYGILQTLFPPYKKK